MKELCHGMMIGFNIRNTTMPQDDKDLLKEKVLCYIKDKEGYNSNEALKVVCDEGHQYFVKYGEDIQIGIVGFGSTPEGAYNDFIDNWEFYSKRKANSVKDTE